MRLTGCEEDLLRHLASMPFLDRLELAAVSGWSRGAVYRAVRSVGDGGLAAPVPHATDLTPLTARFHLTAAGLRRLAQCDGMTLDELLELYPVSARWRRTLIERLDALAVIYRLASAVANIAYPMRLQWYRAAPMDAAILLPGRRTVAVVRQGPAYDRTAFAKRLWRLWEGPLPGAVLLFASDEVRLRHARRLLAGAPVPALLALESDAARAGGDDPVWRLPTVSAAIDLRAALDRARPDGSLPTEPKLSRASLPWDISADRPGQDLPDYMLPSLLKSPEKRTLDLLSDWPLISRRDLASLLAVSEQRASQLMTAVEGFGLVTRLPGRQTGRLALTDLGLALLARRDRASLGIAKRRWSVAPLDTEAPIAWRNVSGARSRQLLRNAEHTDAVHGFVAALARQSRSLGWEIVQLDPPRKHQDTSVMATRCAPSTQTPSASSATPGPPGPSSWSGSAAPCGPPLWPPALRPICATTPPTVSPTTTARGPPSWSSLTTTWRRPTSCAWRGRRWTGRGSESPCGSPTGPHWQRPDRWDAPGARRRARNTSASSRVAEYP